MANFQPAYDKTARSEGGYANVAGDTGGETYAGISRRYWGKWAGWPLVDAAKPLSHNQRITSPALAKMVQDFYHASFWQPIKGDEIRDQDAAAMIYDMAVNAGVKQAVRLAQRALGITETGAMDAATINAINNTKNFQCAS